MDGTVRNWTHEILVTELRSALRNLYDPDELRENILIRSLVGNLNENAADIPHILIAAIEVLKPDSKSSLQSDAWRIYHTLSSRYIQQFQQREVAKELGLSLRQIRRQDNLAIRALGEYLWSHYNLENQAIPDIPVSTRHEVKIKSETDESSGQEEELDWLEKSQAAESVDIDEFILGVLNTGLSLARTLDVRLVYETTGNHTRLFIPLTTTRQALLAVLSAIIPDARGGQINLEVRVDPSLLTILILPAPEDTREITLEIERNENYEIARRLVRLSGGDLEITAPPGHPQSSQVNIKIPTRKQRAVLVIDDNADTLHLFERYLNILGYTFVGTPNPEEAIDLAVKNSPCLILLDVMLPGVDGWELLARLREHPVIRRIPVVVSTILPQEQLALALGAADFVRKPISQAGLLALLDRLTGPESPIVD
jgi:CheY-like chemotaxis protein